jgi:hypothetical protein
LNEVGESTIDRSAAVLIATFGVVCALAAGFAVPPTLWAGAVIIFLAAMATPAVHRFTFTTLLPLWGVAVLAFPEAWRAPASAAIATLAVAAWLWSEESLGLRPAVVVGGALFAASRLIPRENLDVPNLLIVLGGVLLLCALAEEGRLTRLQFAVPFLLVTFVSAATWRSALLPLVGAAAVCAARSRSRLFVALTALLALLCGKMPVVLLLIPLRKFVLPAEDVPASNRAERRHFFLDVALCFALLAGASMLRPYAGGVLLLTALLLFAEARRARSSADDVLAFFVLPLVLFLPWSGGFASGFPLPAGVSLLVVGILGLMFVTAKASLLRHVLIASLLIVLIFLGAPRHVVTTESSLNRPLSAGESFIMTVDPPQPSLLVAASLSNGTSEKPGTVIGRIDVVTVEGKALARPLTIGDVADWGAFRDSSRLATRNRLPVFQPVT